MKKFSSLLTVAAILAIVSCQKSESFEPEEVYNGGRTAEIQVLDGRLKFSSREEFNETVRLLAKQQDKLEDFEKKFDGFVSVRTAFSKMTDKDNETIAKQGVGESYKGYVAIVGAGEDKEITSTIVDPILATLVSKDGWVYIGSDAYYFTRDKFKQVRNSSATKIANVMAGKLTGPDVINGTVSHERKGSAGARPAGTVECIHDYFDGSNKRRMAGDIDYTFYDGASVGVSYESLTIYTKHQRRNLGTYWTYIEAPILSLNGSLTVRTTTSGSYPAYFSQTSFNVSQISKSYPKVCDTTPQGNLCNQSYGDVRSQHAATGTANNNSLSCSISLPF